jgi:hypothetical protein
MDINIVLLLWIGVSTGIVSVSVWVLLRHGERTVTVEQPSHQAVSTTIGVWLLVWAVAALFLSWLGIFNARKDSVVPVIAIGIMLPIVVGYQ